MDTHITHSTTTISRQCRDGLHNFCRMIPTRCACTGCHFGPCADCGVGNLLKTYTVGEGIDTRILCAGCYRKVLAAQPPIPQDCDRCGKLGAFRNPAHRRNEYLCTDCHAGSGEAVVLTGSVAHLVQPCKGADIDDERHAWVHIRGTRFRCLCGADRYDAAVRDKRRRELEREMFQ